MRLNCEAEKIPRHAAVNAATQASLQEVSEGRAFCGLGVRAGLEPFGMNDPRPVKTLRETIAAISGLLSGAPMSLCGGTLSVGPAGLLRGEAR